MAKMRGFICDECESIGRAGRFASQSALEMHRKAKHPTRAPLPPLGAPPKNAMHYRMPGTQPERSRRSWARRFSNVVLVAVGLIICAYLLMFVIKVSGL